MNHQERIMKVLLAPHVSEKTTRAADTANQIVFKGIGDPRAKKLPNRDGWVRCWRMHIGQTIHLGGLEHGASDKKSRFGRFLQKNVDGASQVFLVQRFGNCFLSVHTWFESRCDARSSASE